MRILVNNKIKRLFSCVLIFFILFTAVSVICVSLRVHYAVYCVLLSSLAMEMYALSDFLIMVFVMVSEAVT